MFDGLKKLVGDIKEAATAPGPDLMAVPAVATGVGGLERIPLDVMSAYTAVVVERVEPLAGYGPEATGFVGTKLQAKMRDLQAGQGPAAAGELFAGQHALIEQGLRQRGMPEEQIAAARSRMTGAAAARRDNAWTITTAAGKHVSVQVVLHNAGDHVFESMRTDEANQRTRMHQNSVFEADVREMRPAPYETYYGGGRVAARGAVHDVVVTGRFGTAHDYETLTAFAALALRAVDGA